MDPKTHTPGPDQSTTITVAGMYVLTAEGAEHASRTPMFYPWLKSALENMPWTTSPLRNQGVDDILAHEASAQVGLPCNLDRKAGVEVPFEVRLRFLKHLDHNQVAAAVRLITDSVNNVVQVAEGHLQPARLTPAMSPA